MTDEEIASDLLDLKLLRSRLGLFAGGWFMLRKRERIKPGPKRPANQQPFQTRQDTRGFKRTFR